MSVKSTSELIVPTRPARWPWLLCTVISLLLAGGFTWNLITLNTANPLSRVMESIALMASFILSAVIGTLIITRHPRHTIGWLLLIFPAIIGAIQPLDQLLPLIPSSGPTTALSWLAVWVQGWSWWLVLGPYLVIPLYFPTGRLLSSRWRWVVVALIFLFSAFVLLNTFSYNMEIISNGMKVVNPIGWLPQSILDWWLPPFQLLLATVAVLCVASIFIRYHRAVAIEKKQIQWLFYAYGVFLLVYLPGFILSNFPWFGFILDLVLISFPLVIGISILRYRLWDIDLIIRRTLQYGLLSLLLGLVYFGLVISIGQVVRGITGQESPLVIVFSTLVIAALFNPMRRSLQTLIDRRFYRQKYDAEQATAAFSNVVRREVQLDHLTSRLVALVAETVQPKQVAVWLRPAARPETPERHDAAGK